MNVLIVDDDVLLLQSNKIFLESKGFNVLCLSKGTEALEKIDNFNADIVILDIKMPETDGYTLCEQIKKKRDIPVIFLSSLEQTKDKVKAFKYGGDDYMVKPFSFEELYYRILARAKENNFREEICNIDNFILKDGFLVSDIQKIQLTDKEENILKLLINNKGKVYNLEDIYEIIWGTRSNNDTRVVRIHMSNLRKKLTKISGGKEYIRNHWGEGYEFRI